MNPLTAKSTNKDSQLKLEIGEPSLPSPQPAHLCVMKPSREQVEQVFSLLGVSQKEIMFCA